MHPTIDEQLRGALRLLGKVEDDPGLAPGSRELLTNVRRLITQVDRSQPGLAAFHHADSQRLAALLAPLLSDEQAERLAALGVDEDAPFDPTALAMRNASLRALLSEVIDAIPDRSDGDVLRPLLVQHLRHRLESEPGDRRVAR